jgi:hypothetical protein
MDLTAESATQEEGFIMKTLEVQSKREGSIDKGLPQTKPRKAKYGYLWVTLAFFLISLVGQWAAGWVEYKKEQQEHNSPVEVKDYAVEMTRGTLENWQSEFLQLIWQVAGLAFLWHIGSPQSKEGDDRKEEKLDAILKKLDPAYAQQVLRELELKYPKA